MICTQVEKIPSLPPRLARLRARLEEEFAALPSGHKLVDADEQAIYVRLACEAYSRSQGQPEILRRAAFLRHFAEQFPAAIRADELIVGSQRFAGPPWQRLLTPAQIDQCGIHRNHGHLIVDYGRGVRQGLPGLRSAIREMPPGVQRTAFEQAGEALATLARRHGCAELAERPPASFHEGLQLTWFVQILLRAEGDGEAISFGRLDQFLWPLLDHDLRQGICSETQAVELLGCFFMKCCEGAESQNLTVGGNGEENLLSILVLRAMRTIKVWQPSISVRLGADSSAAFWQEALLLCQTGLGMPSFFNDAVVTAALEKLDIPPDRAADWGIVGCYEASPQGDTYPLTVGGGIALPGLLADYLATAPQPATFADFQAGFQLFVATTYANRLQPTFQATWNHLRDHCPSPFESLCVTGCLEAGRAAEEGGARYNLFGVNLLGLGTLVDSLLAIQTLVFDEGRISLAELTRQLAANFADRHLLARCRALPGKFGSDTPASNALARELSAFIARLVLDSRLDNGVRPYPGFFWFGRDIGMELGASPDGRLAGERISYGCGPGVLLEPANLTAILNAAAGVDHRSCACGNPLTVSLSRNELNGHHGLDLLRQIVDTYFSLGGFHLHLNIVDAEQLRQAQKTPARFQDLTVRISGFSARFVTLGRPWQEAIIERTAKGM